MLWLKGHKVRFFGWATKDRVPKVFEAALEDDGSVTITKPVFNTPSYLHALALTEQGGSSAGIDYLFRARAVQCGTKVQCDGFVLESSKAGELCYFKGMHQGEMISGVFILSAAAAEKLQKKNKDQIDIQMSIFETEQKYYVGFDLPGIPAWCLEKYHHGKVEPLSSLLHELGKKEEQLFKLVKEHEGEFFPAEANIPLGWYCANFHITADHCKRTIAFPTWDHMQYAILNSSLTTKNMVSLDFERK